MTDYKAWLRRRMLEDIYDRMSDDEKKLFFQMTMQNKNHLEIMQALEELKRKADKTHHSFLLDFAANIAGNGAWDGLLWVGSKLLKLR